MKRLLSFLLLLAVPVLIIVFSCGNDRPDPLPEFVTVERIVDSNPELAIRLLDEMEQRAGSLDEASRMKYELLKIRAHDKNYEPLASDSVIRIIRDYYDRKGTANDRMTAYYYMGAYFRDEGDFPQAVEWYQKAFDTADTTQTDFNCDIYNSAIAQIAYICSDSENYKEELEWQKKRKIHHSKTKFIDYTDIAGSYYMNEQVDSAVYYYDKAFKEISRLPRQTIQSKFYISDQMAFFLERNDTAHIRKLAPLFLQSYTEEDPFGVTDMNFGCYYSYCGKSDSAIYYWKKCVQGSKFVTVREAYKYLYQEYKKRGQKDSALYYCDKYVECSDSLVRQNAGERVLKMNRLYNYQGKLKENADLREKFLLSRIWLWSSLFVLSAALWGILAGRRLYRRRILKITERREKNIRELRALRALRKEELTALRGEIEQMQRQYRVTSNRLRRMEEQQQDELQEYHKEIKHLTRMANAEERLEAEGWARVDRIAGKICPGLDDALTARDQHLTRMERRVCKLAVLGIKGSVAGTLIGTSRQNVSRMQSRLCRRLSGGKDEKDLRKVLLELAGLPCEGGETAAETGVEKP